MDETAAVKKPTFVSWLLGLLIRGTRAKLGMTFREDGMSITFQSLISASLMFSEARVEGNEFVIRFEAKPKPLGWALKRKLPEEVRVEGDELRVQLPKELTDSVRVDDFELHAHGFSVVTTMLGLPKG